MAIYKGGKEMKCAGLTNTLEEHMTDEMTGDEIRRLNQRGGELADELLGVLRPAPVSLVARRTT